MTNCCCSYPCGFCAGPLTLIFDESAPDTLLNTTLLTSLTTGALYKATTQVVGRLRDENGTDRGLLEEVRVTSIYTNQPNKIYGFLTIEVEIMVYGKPETYSVIVHEESAYPLSPDPVDLGKYKITSVQGRASFKFASVLLENAGNNLQRLTITFS